MAIDNSLALQIKQPELDIGKTLQHIASIQQGQAHAGLYGLQTQQEARKLNALRVRAQGGSLQDYINAGGDPSVAEQIQKLEYSERMHQTLAQYGPAASTGDPRALSRLGEFPQQLAETSTGIERRAQSAKIYAHLPGDQAEAQTKQLQLRSHIGNMLIADPSQQGVHNAIFFARQAGLPINDFDALKYMKASPDQVLQFANQLRAGGMTAAEGSHATGATAGAEAAAKAPYEPVTLPVGNRVTTRAAVAERSNPELINRAAMSPAAPPPTMVPDVRAQTVPGQARVPARPEKQIENTEGMDPAVWQERVATGKRLAEERDTYGKEARQANDMNFQVDQMRRESETWEMGPLAPPLQSAKNWFKAGINGMGIKTPNWDKEVGDYQAFNKNAMELVRQAVRATSSRAAVQEFKMIQESLPSASMTKNGFHQIADQLQAINDFKIARHRAARDWVASHGQSLEGFSDEWDTHMSPTVFLFQRLSTPDVLKLKATMEKTEQGRKTLARVIDQSKWAAENGIQ